MGYQDLSSTDFFPIESGVPQGSILAPFLYLIYTHELEVNMKSKIKFFADPVT